jgi:hypothetical protein
MHDVRLPPPRRLMANLGFITRLGDIDEGYRRCKEHTFVSWLLYLSEHFDPKFNGCFSQPGHIDREAKYLSAPNWMFERDVIQRDRDEAVSRVVETRSDIRELIKPLQQVAAKQGTLIVQMLRKHEFSMVHLQEYPF